jgi:ABC-type polysaccharide/polyol phosphate transport system ATPase subunit
MSSEAPPAVELQRVWKRYLLGQGAGAKGALLSLIGRGSARDARWSLRDLSLEVRRSESIGLIGHNGAGKTTTLKLLAGITQPSRGTVRTRGRVASLLNVGAGFHADLTGRENVYLNGVILGLSKRELRRRYDAIVDFAGIKDFMDTPVKRYSAGMYARLAFAVAVHVDPDVLLVDEVLSVGDAAFQDRSLRRMLQFRDSGAAVFFVSHNLGAVELMCQRAVWLERGTVRAIGPTSEVIRAYLDALDEVGETSSGSEPYLTFDRTEILDDDGAVADCLAPDQPFTVRASGQALQDLLEPVFVVTIRGDYGPLFAGNMHIDGNWPERIPAGPFTVECVFGPPCLRPGTYRVELKVKQNVRTNYFEPRVLARLTVRGESTSSLGGGAVGQHWRPLSA